ncbi:anthranilate synthase component I family protein [Frondihabitans cladoniiphilus]|uniref:Chorismate-utilising enzyme C-terminal domain-containing protein n=1 Tax=Frondihabitans cladoniiphilus TaxID=715785 RepID=A0ABP8VLU0_9MICO
MSDRPTRRNLDGWVDPERVVHALGATGDVVWFDRPGGRSLVGWGSEVLRASARQAGSLAAAWERVRGTTGPREAGAPLDEPLGWWGLVGYGAGADLLEPGDATWAGLLGDPVHPDLALLDVDRALVFDETLGTVEAVVRSSAHAWLDDLRETWDALRHSIASSPPSVPEPVPAAAPRLRAEWADTREAYLDAIRRCQETIARGDAWVMCLTTSVRVRGVAEPDLEVYGRLRRATGAPRASFARLGSISYLGASPETLLTVDADGLLESEPIKGTRPRSVDAALDARIAAELAADEKERAENLMIVDLLRNDLSRVAVPGSIEVAELFAVRSYTQVHQLVSRVRARLRAGLTGVDAVQAVFPPGSMTGAPKEGVVRMLGLLESEPRGFYAGAVGRFGSDGTVDLGVVIRSIVLDRTTGVARVGVGGGITQGSIPSAEWDEVRLKAEVLLTVLGAV